MTPWLIKLWIVAYLITVAFSLWERRWPWALYYFSAALIPVAVLWMGETDGSDR